MRVVLSAAIMDMCHNGHINLLKELRANGDKVIMVLHDDASCYRIKGKIPIQNIKQRKKNLKITGLVDKIYVTKNEDPSDKFEKVLQRYEDVIFIRGNDNKDFPGKWMLKSYGTPIKFIPYTKGVSSSAIRKKLYRKEKKPWKNILR